MTTAEILVFACIGILVISWIVLSIYIAMATTKNGVTQPVANFYRFLGTLLIGLVIYALANFELFIIVMPLVAIIIDFNPKIKQDRTQKN